MPFLRHSDCVKQNDHGHSEIRCKYNCSSIFCKVRVEIPLKHRCSLLKVCFKKPHVNKTLQKTAAFGRLCPSKNGIQVVSLESFVGIKLCQAVTKLMGQDSWEPKWDSPGIVGLESVGLYGWNSVGYGSKTIKFDGAYCSARVQRATNKIILLMTSRNFLART